MACYIIYVLLDCSCIDYINKQGYGNCAKVNRFKFGGKPACYVNLPSTCSDIKDSSTDPGKKWSAEACNSGIITLYR